VVSFLIVLAIVFIPSVIYYYIQYRIDCKHIDFKRQTNEESKRVVHFNRKVEAPYELESEMIRRCQTSSMRDWVYNELHDDLVDVFGENYKEIFFLPSRTKEYRTASNCGFWAVCLLLAHKGYVDGGSYILGYPIGGSKERDWNIAICKKIEWYLVKQFPEEGDNVRFFAEASREYVYDHVRRKTKYIWSPSGMYGITLRLGAYIPEDRRRRPWND